MENRKKGSEGWMNVFVPNVHVLSEGEIAGLPEDKRRVAERADYKGTWLRIPCPDKSCVEGDGKVTLRAPGVEKEEKGIWLDIFCPQDYCLYKSGMELP